MLLGDNLLNFDIGEIEEGDFFIRFKVRNREDDFKFNLIRFTALHRWSINPLFCQRWCWVF